MPEGPAERVSAAAARGRAPRVLPAGGPGGVQGGGDPPAPVAAAGGQLGAGAQRALQPPPHHYGEGAAPSLFFLKQGIEGVQHAS